MKFFAVYFLSVFIVLFTGCEQVVSHSVVPPLPDPRSVFIESNPPGAAIFLNGRNMGQTTPDSVVWIQSDSNSIVLRLPLYRDSMFQQTIPANQITRLFIDFTQNPKMRGGIACYSLQPECEILLNDSVTGLKTPALIHGLLPGQYKITFRKQGYLHDYEYITVRSDQYTTAHFSLTDTTVWLSYTEKYFPIPELYFNTLHIDKKEVKWLGGSSSGLTRFNELNWVNYNTSNSDIPSNVIKKIISDPRNVLWIGTNAGLARFDGNNFRTYTTLNSLLPDNQITTLRPGGGDTILIGTQHGLCYVINNEIHTFNNSPVGSQWVNDVGISPVMLKVKQKVILQILFTK